MSDYRILSPEDPLLNRLCDDLLSMAGDLDTEDAWPRKQLELCGQVGLFEWFLPKDLGGQGWSDVDVVRGYLKLSEACLTTTFVLTQLTSACRRIAASETDSVKERFIPDLLTGNELATLGISHLTTSRRHLARPVLLAEEGEGGYMLDGYIPWVTGAPFAQYVVTGAGLEDGRQILTLLPLNIPGVSIPPTHPLVGLSASRTGEIRLDKVKVDREWLLAGPIEEVLKTGRGGQSGGVQTSTLAVGLASACIAFLEQEAQRRDNLVVPAEALRREQTEMVKHLLASAAGDPSPSTEAIRTQANSLVLRASQASLAAAKGAGYVASHPVGRWCREALFFLVWSCPQPVAAANLCELAGV